MPRGVSGDGLAATASRTRSALRFSARSKTSKPTPVLARSAGISADFRQPPLAYSSKSSPGFTDKFRYAGVIPIVFSVALGSADIAVVADAIKIIGARSAIFIPQPLTIVPEKQAARSGIGSESKN